MNFKGDSSKPRSWSKYASDSSRNIINNKDSDKPEDVNTNKTTDKKKEINKKDKKEENVKPEVKEALEKVYISYNLLFYISC